MSNRVLLDAIAAEVAVCTKCKLWKTRKKAVPGSGNPESRLLFIGEAPGKSEDKTGESFVGAAGKLLNTLLLSAGLTRTGIFVTNIVKCRPPRNRDPTPEETATCGSYLKRQLAVLEPKFIVTLGNHSTAHVFTEAGIPFTGICRTRGRIRNLRLYGTDMTVFPTFHPAAALYREQYKELLINDFQHIGNDLREKELVDPRRTKVTRSR